MADSTILVRILGDAKSLSRAADQAEGSVAGFNKRVVTAGSIIAGAFVTDQLLDFSQTAIKEADRIGDATTRLNAQLGDLAPAIIDAADNFAALGQSEGDMLELAARITDIGKGAGLTNTEIGKLALSTSEAAAKMALLDTEGRDANFWIEQIGKGSQGTFRALSELGVSLSDAEVNARALAMTGKDTAEALTEGELAAARLDLIMEKLSPRLGEVSAASADVEQRQAELQARFETLTGKIGQAVEGPLNDLLGWIITGIDGWALLSERVGGFDKVMADALTPVARMIDLQRELVGVLAQAIGLLNDFLGLAGQVGQGPIIGPNPLQNRPGSSGGFGSGGTYTVNVQGGSPEVIEQSVIRALQQATGKGALQ